jgi:hypothetical protein
VAASLWQILAELDDDHGVEPTATTTGQINGNSSSRPTRAARIRKVPFTCAKRQPPLGIRAMPSARALLVASLLTEPPYGCLGPSGNDRYRKSLLRSQTVGASQVNCQVAAALFAMKRPPAEMFGQALSQIAASTESLWSGSRALGTSDR